MLFYDNLNNYLYEHYETFQEKVKDKLIEEISESFIQNPKNYKFRGLRHKLFEENKEAITSILTDEQILEETQRVLEEYTHKKTSWSWKWHEAIAKFIIKNMTYFLESEAIQKMFYFENKRLKDENERLKERIEEIKSNLED